MRSRAPAIQQSVFARKRMRSIILVLSPLVLLGTIGAAWVLNTEYQSHNLLRDSVQKMLSAPSYSAVGLESTIAGGNSRDVREKFDFIAPDQASSRYIVSTRQQAITGVGDCLDTSLVIQGSVRHRKCNDPGPSSAEWTQETHDPAIFRSLAFQPWRRVSWCADFDIQEPQALAEAKTQVYTCAIPVDREATELGVKIPALGSGARVQVTVWVRETDGFIGRFLMEKTWPAMTGSVTQKLDYVYSNFGGIPAIQLSVPQASVASIPAGSAASGIVTPPRTGAAPTTGAAAPSGVIPVPAGGGAGAAPQPSRAAAAADINAQKGTMSGRTFYLELAKDDYTIGRGLSNRPAISPDTAMLFVMPKEDNWAFWMKDTLIPLDVLYLDSQMRIVDIYQMVPEPGVPQDRLTRYRSRLPALYALEIKGGLAKAYGLDVGDVLTLH